MSMGLAEEQLVRGGPIDWERYGDSCPAGSIFAGATNLTQILEAYLASYLLPRFVHHGGPISGTQF